jgi:hypothetical protein
MAYGIPLWTEGAMTAFEVVCVATIGFMLFFLRQCLRERSTKALHLAHMRDALPPGYPDSTEPRNEEARLIAARMPEVPLYRLQTFGRCRSRLNRVGILGTRRRTRVQQRQRSTPTKSILAWGEQKPEKVSLSLD